MEGLSELGDAIGKARRLQKISQLELARKARVSRATLDALENGRAGEMGFAKITRILASLGMELRLQPAASRRPTLEDLMEEDRDDQSLDRRR